MDGEELREFLRAAHAAGEEPGEAPKEPIGTRFTQALWYPALQISQVLSEAQNEPTTNWPGLTVSTFAPTSSTIPTYS